MQTNNQIDEESPSNEDFEAALAGDPRPEPEKIKPIPWHVTNFYDRMNIQLDEKGVWGKTQVAKSMRGLLLREQNVTARRTPEKFGRLDRKRLVDKLVKEGKIVKIGPRNVAEVSGTIHPATVDAMVESLPAENKTSPEEVTAAIGQLFRIRDTDVLLRRTLRAKRWMLNNPTRRPPIHVREGAILTTAIMLATAKLFPDACTEEHLAAAKALRFKHGEIEEAS